VPSLRLAKNAPAGRATPASAAFGMFLPLNSAKFSYGRRGLPSPAGITPSAHGSSAPAPATAAARAASTIHSISSWSPPAKPNATSSRLAAVTVAVLPAPASSLALPLLDCTSTTPSKTRTEAPSDFTVMTNSVPLTSAAR
jgi:hypothetical protein